MRAFLGLGAALLATLGACCANSGDHAMTDHARLDALSGRWTGLNTLWFMPEDPARESDATATVSRDDDGALTIAYTWAYEGTPQRGTLTVHAEPDAGGVAAVLSDSWHTGGKPMAFRDDADSDGLVALLGTYAAPPGPDWGWRIVVDARGADAFHMLMDNITPEGEETRAVEARFTRTSSAP